MIHYLNIEKIKFYSKQHTDKLGTTFWWQKWITQALVYIKQSITLRNNQNNYLDDRVKMNDNVCGRIDYELDELYQGLVDGVIRDAVIHDTTVSYSNKSNKAL